MELDRVNIIRQSENTDLLNSDYLEDMIIKLGFNREILTEQPKVVKDNGGGLLIWQYPNQFSKYLCLLGTKTIRSYIEVGCRWGGTFVLTTEYLKKFNDVKKSVAVDIIDSPVEEYCKLNDETEFLKMDSQSQEFKTYMETNEFDLVFIDGDHTYSGVMNDYEVCKNSGKVFVFHDIVNNACPGVVQFWNELKYYEQDTYDFYEFTEQYLDVWEDTHQTFLGIGVAIKKYR